MKAGTRQKLEASLALLERAHVLVQESIGLLPEEVLVSRAEQAASAQYLQQAFAGISGLMRLCREELAKEE